MMAVGNEAGDQAVVCKLVRDVVRMPFDHGMSAIAQMRAHPRSGIDGGANLVARRLGMPDGYQHATPGDLRNEGRRALIFRRERQQLDLSSRRILDAAELIQVRRPDMLPRMGSPGTVIGGDVRPLHMNARNSSRYLRQLVDRLGNGRE